jgi:hypothetical protein
MMSATSGLALLWCGWVVLVFFVVLWLLRTDSDAYSPGALTFILMALLGQGAIVTGTGLAVIDTIGRLREASTRSDRRHRPQEAGVSPNQAGKPNATLAYPVARGEEHDVKLSLGELLSGRDAVLLADGTIELTTRLGRRRFASIEDARMFVHGPARAVRSELTTH